MQAPQKSSEMSKQNSRRSSRWQPRGRRFRHQEASTARRATSRHWQHRTRMCRRPTWLIPDAVSQWTLPPTHHAQQHSGWPLYRHHKHTYIHPFNGSLASTRKVKPIWILLKQETVSGTGIHWAICKSAPRSRQIITPAPHHSVFYRPDVKALKASQNAPKYSMAFHGTPCCI